jgi:DNA-directed RNA polymerase subunit beta'
LKENVIVGRLIPAGTGGAIARLRHVATERDRAIQEELAKNQPPQIEGPQPQAAAE